MKSQYTFQLFLTAGVSLSGTKIHFFLEPRTPKTQAVAHAGGGVNGKRYSNSIQALDYNYARGFELFELDFSWTSDGHLVCLHDWDKTPKWLLNYDDQEPLTLAAFRALENPKLGLKPCDLTSLNQWLIQHPDARIITDIKGRNLVGLEFMKAHITDAEKRLIPQFTQPQHYHTVKALGFEQTIWTLFSFREDNTQVVKAAQSMQLFAITMPKARAQSGLAHMIKPLGIPTYVHTINDLSVALDYQSQHGLTSIYTDFLEHHLQQATP